MSRYSDIPLYRSNKINKGKIYQKSARYPEIPLNENDVYVITSQGDRFDLLARQFYKESEYWWIISVANEKLKQNSLFIPEGTQLRIPMNLQGVISAYNTLNNS